MVENAAAMATKAGLVSAPPHPHPAAGQNGGVPGGDGLGKGWKLGKPASEPPLGVQAGREGTPKNPRGGGGSGGSRTRSARVFSLFLGGGGLFGSPGKLFWGVPSPLPPPPPCSLLPGG